MVENEIQFLSWAKFKRMAPSILQLEVSRLGSLIQGSQLDDDVHNTLVRARFALKTFITCLDQTERAQVEDGCADHLRTALLNVSMVQDRLEGEAAQTLNYIIDRLRYVHDRIGLIY